MPCAGSRRHVLCVATSPAVPTKSSRPHTPATQRYPPDLPSLPVHRIMPISRLGVALAIASVTSLATAQESPEQSSRHFAGVDSGFVENSNPAAAARGLPEVVWSTVVTVPNSAWLRLTYSGVLLSGAREPGTNGSFVRLTSLRDGQFQTQHLLHIEQWQETSAYFNGDAVLVELLAQPGTGQNRLMIGDVIAGPVLPGYPDTICGSTDDRVLSTDPRAARNQPTGCTSWLINDCNHCFLTAGHCAAGVNVVQFNVPLSTSSGAIQHPGPQDQYAVDAASKQTNGGLGTGDDWCYFGVFPNSTTNLSPHQANGGQAYDLLNTPPAVSGQNIRVTGYGSTTSPVSPTWYLVQKTHVGPYASFAGTTVRYTTDTTGGNSGSPVFLDGTNQAIGIHTHGGCTSTGGSNVGTGSNHAGLQAALANPLGVCDCPALVFGYPNGLPSTVAPNGTTTLRIAISGPVPLLAGSVRLHVSTGGAFLTIVPTALPGNQFEAAFPANPCLTPLQFYVSAQDTSSNTYRDPQNAPTSVRAALYADGLATVRNYNFNTTPAGWSVTNTALTTGAWVRGAPVDPRGPTADFDGSGQCWVTGNTSNEDVDGGPTVLRTETFDLSARNDPYVQYARWFANDDNDDRLIVEASGNGGTSWTPIENLGPYPGWVLHRFRLRSYFSNLAQIVIRWSVADNPNNSVTEAALDAFRIDDVTCTPASWVAFGSGCAGGNGVPALQMISAPALGTTFSLSANNLAGGAAFMITGLAQQSVALQPFGFGAGCTLLVTGDAVALIAQAGGTASWSMAIPNAPSLAALHLWNQVVELGAIPAVSNGGNGEIR